MTDLVVRTLRDDPADADTAGHRLLVRAGYTRQVAAGIFSLLPLGVRVRRRVEAILREEMEAIGAQEVVLPIVHPADLWRRSGRWDDVGSELARLTDAAGRDLCLAMTHEEAVCDLVGQVLGSYRQLPLVVYQIQTKFRDEARPRGGLIRLREFAMKDAYSFHASEADLESYYPEMGRAYHRAFARMGLHALAVASDPGMMGGGEAHEFMVLSEVGEDTLVLCDACGYRANRQVASFRRDVAPGPAPGPPTPVDTPGAATIAALASCLHIDASETAKAVLLVATPGERLVFAVVRGDHELSETKLASAVGARELRPATAEEIRAVGAWAGYASPVGLAPGGALVVVDEAVAAGRGLVAGANREGVHLRDVVCGRDYVPDRVADIAAAADGLPCARCGAPLRTARGVEVGNIFKLGTRYSVAMGTTFAAPDGALAPAVMGCYGIGVERAMAVVVECHHDERGIVWPVTVAPFEIVVLSVGAERDPAVAAAAERLTDDLGRRGVDVLYDDRPERAGVKFNDADLLGVPVRVTVGSRALAAGEVEVRLRREVEGRAVPVAAAADEVVATLGLLRAEVDAAVAAASLEWTEGQQADGR